MRGDWNLPAGMSETGLHGGSRSLYRELKRGFTAAGADLHKGARKAARLRILEEYFDKRILSLDVTGGILEYELLYVLKFDVIGIDDTVIVEPQRLRLIRDYLYVSEDVYGASRQEELLRDRMYREMVDLMLLRIKALAG